MANAATTPIVVLEGVSKFFGNAQVLKDGEHDVTFHLISRIATQRYQAITRSLNLKIP
ncbi:hypothetical protein [Rhizobium jaguaris]|uniref:hypothetical protein n=1 Tax=Rhizobium jaguaris TaxID=1312183 RepID=UPI0013C4B179|nr:hypothetical protein [Rhizobium jaguaris]